jgi:hypothetical protein
VRLVVDLVSPVSLQPVDPERERGAQPASPDAGGATVGQIDRPLELVALEQGSVGKAGRGAVVAPGDVRRHPQHRSHSARAQRRECLSRIWKPDRIESQRAQAPVRLPGIVENHPTEWDSGPAQPVGILE